MPLFLGNTHWSLFKDKGHHVYNFEMFPKKVREKICAEFFVFIFVNFCKPEIISKWKVKTEWTDYERILSIK